MIVSRCIAPLDLFLCRGLAPCSRLFWPCLTCRGLLALGRCTWAYSPGPLALALQPCPYWSGHHSRPSRPGHQAWPSVHDRPSSPPLPALLPMIQSLGPPALSLLVWSPFPALSPWPSGLALCPRPALQPSAPCFVACDSVSMHRPSGPVSLPWPRPLLQTFPALPTLPWPSSPGPLAIVFQPLRPCTSSQALWSWPSGHGPPALRPGALRIFDMALLTWPAGLGPPAVGLLVW